MGTIGTLPTRRANLRRLLLAAGADALAVAALLGPAAADAAHATATGTWSVQPSPVATAPQGEFGGVSCPSAAVCIAVGSAVSRADGNQTALAERWNGTTWAMLKVPRPAGAVADSLSAVSCTSATACTAVGFESTGGAAAFPLAERWNGTTWAVQPIPHEGEGSYLLGVSCASATACTAVGQIREVPDQLALAERWNGTKWVIQKVPNATFYDSLSAVSCPAAGVCTAVGAAYTHRGASRTLAERWNGTTWAVQNMPSPDGHSTLSGVSCTSGTACTAVGSTNGSPATALAERWNGTTWAVQQVPDPATADFLLAVSCASSTACTAVGFGDGGHGYTPSGTLAEHWNGTTWSGQPTPHHGQTVQLNSVSCPAATSCTATGTDTTGTGVTLAEGWNGTTWAIQPSPSPVGAEASGLAGISCTSAAACVTVGSANAHKGGFGGGTLAQQWNGTRWVTEPTPAVPGALRGYLSDSGLSGVSCTSASACTAVGHYRAPSPDGAGYYAGLAERWNGTAWAVQPTPTSAEYSPLSGVSCTSATSCTAVGTFFNLKHPSPYKVLAERWNGKTWAVEAAPSPAGAVSMGGVSCTSATACTLVGSYESGDNQYTLAERWDGSTWTIQPSPNAAGSFESWLTGVSCTSATACMAVGYASGTKPGSIDVPLAERWNGSAWTIVPTRNPAGSAITELDGVSCTSAAACTAVGRTLGATTSQVPLAEQWNGTTWAIQATPAPGASSNALDGVSCPRAVPCTAAGNWDTTIGRPLVERRS